MRTLESFIKKHKRMGLHFFDAHAMRFFESKIHGDLHAGKFFITSEQFIDSTGQASPRRYTIRKIDWETAQVEEYNGFQKYKTLASAMLAMSKIH